MYKALEGINYIRLIVLHPASSDNAPLRISFRSSTLEDIEGRYDAISYTWGQPILTFALHVDDGTQVCVTRNLDKALRYLRYNERERLLWADAACINQNDNDEKAIQIPLMVQIFRGARKVMAWLDPGGDTTVEQKGMRLLERLSRLSKTKAGIFYDDLSTVLSQLSKTKADMLYQDFDMVLKFLKLPWFNRLWIVQEVVFNLEVCLICGETELPFSRLVSALSVIKPRDSGREPSYMAELEAIVEIGRLWNLYSLFREKLTENEKDVFDLYQSPPKPYSHIIDETRILDLLEKFGLYECTDPRDRIFALCTMANDVRAIENTAETDGSHPKYLPSSTEDDRIRIDINYSMDVREIYEAFALPHLMGTTNANLTWRALLMRQHSPPPMDWPSWVPDWRVSPREIRRGNPLDYDKGLDYSVHKIATGIIRVSISVTRSILNGKGEQLYTVNSKISKETKDPQMSFDSQLFQLYRMLQIPETAQGPHQLPTQSASTPRMLNLIDFPNLLVHIFLECGSSFDPFREVHSKLEHYLARTSIEPDSQHSSEPSSGDARRLIEEFAEFLGNSNTLFSFRDLATGITSVGYGNTALELGDSLLPLKSYRPGMNKMELKTEHMLIIRPVYTIEDSDGEKQIYRLVGDAYVFDPTTVLIGMESKKRYYNDEYQRANGYPDYFPSEGSRYQLAKEETALRSSLGIHELDQVVYLA